jgi:hypothetical protein
LPDYQSIILDEALLEELERSAPNVFKSGCHGDRLMQVEPALEASSESGAEAL